VTLPHVLLVLTVGLAVSLVSSLVILPASRFRATTYYAVYLLLVYALFLGGAVLVELQVLHL